MADETELVHVERRDDGVAVMTLDNPKVNALSSALLAQLKAAAEELHADPPGAVVITGGDRVFAAGADISEFGGPHEAAVIGGHFVATLDAIAAIPRMVIAAVSGVALGGGCEIALACDLRIVSEKARFGQPEILLGIIPGGGGTQRLARLVGAPPREGHHPHRPAGRRGRGAADRARRRGGRARGAARPRIERAAELARGAVVAQGLAKKAIDAGLDLSLADGLQLEQENFVEVFRTADSQIGVKSFLENGPGKAVFTGH